VRRVAHPTPFLNTAQHRASTPPQPRRRLVRPGHAPRRRWPCARRIAAADGARRAHASDRKSQLLARHGQNDSDIAVGKHNWLFAGSLRAGQRAAAVMTLVNSARLNGHDPPLHERRARTSAHPQDVGHRRVAAASLAAQAVDSPRIAVSNAHAIFDRVHVSTPD